MVAGDGGAGFVFDDGVDDELEAVDGFVEAGDGEVAGARGSCGVEELLTFLDVGAREPEGEGGEGGFVVLGDFDEGEVGGVELVEEVGEGGFGGVEELGDGKGGTSWVLCLASASLRPGS